MATVTYDPPIRWRISHAVRDKAEGIFSWRLEERTMTRGRMEWRTVRFYDRWVDARDYAVVRADFERRHRRRE